MEDQDKAGLDSSAEPSSPGFFGKRGAVTASNNAPALRVGAIAAHESQLHEAPIFNRGAESRLQTQLCLSGNGSALRGWRWILDPEGNLEVQWDELCQVCISSGFVQNQTELKECLKTEPSGKLKLVQVLSELGVLVEMFQRWMVDSFGGQSAWFMALDAEYSGTVSKDSFMKLCRKEGFTVNDEELQELFGLCDISDKNSITRELTIFLETDDNIRELERMKLKNNQKYEQDRLLVSCYNEFGYNNESLPMKHRLAIRQWQKHTYEALPTISRHRVVSRDNTLRRNALQARCAFIRHLRSFHGTEVRAWRRGLDPEGKFAVSKSAFKQYCRTIDLEEDINALWVSLDPAKEGQLKLEQLCLQAADLLATFRTWATDSFGSCLGLFQTPEAIKRRQQRRADGSFFVKPSMSVSSFSSLLWAYGYPPLFQQDGDLMLWYLSATLDFHGGSLISCSDLEWLDTWRPTEWLVAEPSEAAWLRIRALLEDKFGTLCSAWRKDLDVNNRNRLTWPEWCEACRKNGVGADVNIACAWRHLDHHRLGYISLKEVCKESAAILTNFKSWAESRFSSMQEAFKAMDSDGGGTLSLGELKGACYKYKCGIEAKALFTVLSRNGRNVSWKDVNFLSDWASADEDALNELKKVTADLWQEVLTAHRNKQSLKPESERHPLRRPHSSSKIPSRFGSFAAASASSCIPADFALGTPFPASPYSLPVARRPQSCSGKMRRRRTLSRGSASATSHAASRH